ncbi:MAG: Ig-like domain-containing protein [Prevotella sp.]|nr:Ig-like domain-containing protein [Prevotella sp.]
MRKVSVWGIILMCVMCGVSTSCGDDKSDDSPTTLSVNPSSVSLYYEGTQQLSASGVTSWSSENEFVAKVDAKGLVTANHVGSTNILASNGNAMGRCAVTVKPKYNCYDTPLLNWGASASAISAAETHTASSSSSSTSLGYGYTNGSVTSVVLYMFENNALKSVGVLASYSNYAQIALYLLERYQPIAKDDDGNYYFIDSMDTKTANNVIALSTTTVSNSKMTMVLYMPNSQKASAPQRRAQMKDFHIPEDVLSILLEH